MKRTKAKHTVLVLPDMQAPFIHRDSLPFVKAVIKQYNPDRLIQIGDLFDGHALSRYDHDPDGFSAGDELAAAVKSLQPYYKALRNVTVVKGNHDARLERLAYSVGIPKRCLNPLEMILEFPDDWKYVDRVSIDGVDYEHGHKFGNGGGASAFKRSIDSNMTSTVYGHFHSKAGIMWFANAKYLNFAFNVGCLMDTKSYAAQYGDSYLDRPILGVGLIIKGIPTYIPMVLVKGGRWRGYL